MFKEPADPPAAEQPSAPIGMRELAPQPARPVMPAYTMPAPTPVRDPGGPGADDSVVARDDHVEGTFTSRGTVVVMGSLKGRIEAVRVRIEAGATVEADVIVDEAIIAGEFSGNLTCRERLEAQASGRIHGHVETYKLMLHEGARVEGEMHMLSEAPRDASLTVRGTAPLRGEARPTAETTATGSPGATPGSPGATAGVAVPMDGTLAGPPPRGAAGTPPTKPPTVVAPSSAAKGSPGPAGAPRPGTTAPGTPGSASAPSVPVSGAPPGAEAPATRQRNAIVETLRLESLRVAPRSTTPAPRRSSTAPGGNTGSNGSRGRGGGTTTAF